MASLPPIDPRRLYVGLMSGTSLDGTDCHSLGWLFLYELLHGEVQIRLTDADSLALGDSHEGEGEYSRTRNHWGPLLLRLLPAAEYGQKSVGMSILRILANNPNLKHRLPAFERIDVAAHAAKVESALAAGIKPPAPPTERPDWANEESVRKLITGVHEALELRVAGMRQRGPTP